MLQSQFIAPCSREMVKKLSLFNVLGWKRIARQQWRARIETGSNISCPFRAVASPASNGGRLQALVSRLPLMSQRQHQYAVDVGQKPVECQITGSPP